ncbi:Rho GTPase-activating protein 6 [Plecturocebus cupreus]
MDATPSPHLNLHPLRHGHIREDSRDAADYNLWGDFTWNSMSGRSVRLRSVPIQSLSELERARLQEVAFYQLQQDCDLSCQITIPKGTQKSRIAVWERPPRIQRMYGNTWMSRQKSAAGAEPSLRTSARAVWKGNVGLKSPNSPYWGTA